MRELTLFDQATAEGEALRDAALEHHEAQRGHLLAACRLHLAKLATGGRIVDADDARDFILAQPDGAQWLERRKDWMGALFAKRGEWEPVGWKKSRHPENHARHLRTWRLKTFQEG